MKRLQDYRGIVDDKILADLYRRASRLLDMHVVHMNSTAYGGGVAELLGSVVPLMNDAGVDAGWRVLVGDMDFFEVTKKFHNSIQGAPIDLTENKKRVYIQTNASFSQYTHIGKHDLVVIHDPQPLPIIQFYRKRQPWIWRCHIDLSEPDPVLWEFLKAYIIQYDMMIVSHKDYMRDDLPVEQRIINPAIDPLSQKNHDLDEDTVRKYMQHAGIPLNKPIVTQISRFDIWKDPEGVVEIFKRVREKVDCRLVLAGNTATDDPEGGAILERTRAAAGSLADDGDIIFLLGASDTVINALQRAATVVLQKSTREGFGLTVSEAMWKGTPVIAGNVGGIPLQIVDGESGFLLDPKDFDAWVDRIVELVENPDEAKQIGLAGKERVRENFLVTRLLGHWLALMAEVMECRCRIPT